MRKQTILILLILTNIWNNIHSYNLKQIADKEYMTNSSITSLVRMITVCYGLAHAMA